MTDSSIQPEVTTFAKLNLYLRMSCKARIMNFMCSWYKILCFLQQSVCNDRVTSWVHRRFIYLYYPISSISLIFLLICLICLLFNTRL